ncbi:MAG: hypothetical protein QM744_04925 [Mesorhizobium sp.]
MDIVGLGDEAAATLNHFVRIAVTGWLPRAEDLAEGWDGETPIKPPSAPSSRARLFPWLVFAASAGLLILGAGLVAKDVYYGLTRIRAEAAAISAPRTDLISHEYGTVAPDVAAVGTPVTQGKFLVRIISDDVEAAIKMEAADLALLQENDPTASSNRREIVRSRLAALERRKQALTYRSQCVCKVIWAAAPNSPVAPGTLLLSLVSSGAAEIRVEAFVSPADALDITPGQLATVTPAGSAVSHTAHVSAVKYEFVPAPKVGLGRRDGFVTVELAIDGAVDDSFPEPPQTF